MASRFKIIRKSPAEMPDFSTKPTYHQQELCRGAAEIGGVSRRARRTGKGQNEAVDAAIAQYRRLSPCDWRHSAKGQNEAVDAAIAQYRRLSPCDWRHSACGR